MDAWEILKQAGELEQRGQEFALATVVWRQGPSSSQRGARAIITAEGELRGWIGGACAEPVVIREAQRVIADGTPRLLLLGSPEQFGAAVPDGITVVPISCQSEGALEVYIEPVVPAPHLVIVGRSPMVHTLADLARALNWRTELVAGEDFTPAHAGRQSMVIVATQGHGDEEAVEQAVAARPAYLGLVGSRRRGAAVLGYLADRGLPADQLDRVHVPAGLDLGHTTHQEIAVAILAELVQLRASGALAGAAGAALARHTTPAAGAPAGQAPPARQAGPGRQPEPGRQAGPGGQPEPAEAVDPVCGMTVAAARAGHPLPHDGVTYYFCSTSCRRKFELDPAAYATRETRC
jgi:xanthine dehydrogenase accessory factor